MYDLSGTTNIIQYDKTSDIYPLLGKCDLMITDYSSIFVDYLLLDRPVVFFPFDRENYIKNERALQFDYDKVTPGRKCLTHDELEDELKRIIVDGKDDYIEERKRILKHFFDTADGNSCDRILEYVEKHKKHAVDDCSLWKKDLPQRHRGTEIFLCHSRGRGNPWV